MHAHAHAIVLTYAHALRLARADAVTRTCAADPDLIRTIGLTPARALADAIAGELAGAIALARASAVGLADTIDLDLSILSAFDFDLGRVRELASVHAASLDRAYALARGIPRAADRDLAGVFGLPSVTPLTRAPAARSPRAPAALGRRRAARRHPASCARRGLASWRGGPPAARRPPRGIRARAVLRGGDPGHHAAAGGPPRSARRRDP